MKVILHKSISEIDESKWNSIVAKNHLICTYKYLESVEKSEINDCRYYYPVVYEGNEIIAHTSVYFITTELDTFAQGFIKKIIIDIRKKWKNFLILRSLECGTPVALGTTISFKNGINRVNALNLICQNIEHLAKELHIPVLLFRDFYNEELELFDHLTELGYTGIHNLPGTKIEVRWKSFNEYLNSIRSHYKWKIIERIKKCQRDNISIEILNDYSRYYDDLEKLWMNVYNNAKEYRREILKSVFFKQTKEYLGDKSSIILIKKDNIPIGFTLLWFDDETLIPIFSGLDYNYNDEYGIYFNLLYKIVEVAIDKGKKDIDLGITTLIPKKEMGAETVTLNMYMKHLNPLLNKIVPWLFETMTPQDNAGERKVFKSKLNVL
ncbi:GNAT family N-acetyltransferase [Candidatus Desantisbacteria bacterium]|nr:GNAT family N-acetyltransferase [Candidatus Desantisbacteria bacterium]